MAWKKRCFDFKLNEVVLWHIQFCALLNLICSRNIEIRNYMSTIFLHLKYDLIELHQFLFNVTIIRMKICLILFIIWVIMGWMCFSNLNT